MWFHLESTFTCTILHAAQNHHLKHKDQQLTQDESNQPRIKVVYTMSPDRNSDSKTIRGLWTSHRATYLAVNVQGPGPSLLHSHPRKGGQGRDSEESLRSHCLLLSLSSETLFPERDCTQKLTSSKIMELQGDRKVHPYRAQVEQAEPYLQILHFSFSLFPDAENKKKRMRGWGSFLLLLLLTSLDIHQARIGQLFIFNQQKLYSFLLLILKGNEIFSIFYFFDNFKGHFCL